MTNSWVLPDSLAPTLLEQGFEGSYQRQIISATGKQQVERFLFLDGSSVIAKMRLQAEANFFACEAAGLKLLSQTASKLRLKLRAATVYAWQEHFILLEDIESAANDSHFWQQFGRDLAQLHLHQGSNNYGLEQDNFIGSRQQSNGWHTNWASFFASQRLQPRLEQLWQQLNQKQRQQSTRLLQRLPELLPEAAPSLLHGDLWAGNFISNQDGAVVLIDPAIYYGHSEADLAMTQLFGGFASLFYRSYAEIKPLEAGFQQRYDIYNLFHLCNHWLSFGDSYRKAVLNTLQHYG